MAMSFSEEVQLAKQMAEELGLETESQEPDEEAQEDA